MSAISLAHEAQLARALEVAGAALAGRAPEAVPVDELAAVLYGQWYAVPNAPAALLAAAASERSSRHTLPLAAILRATHPDAEVWEPAVVVRSGLHGTVVVRMEAAAYGRWRVATSRQT